MSSFEVDDSLEDRLKSHGISRRNIRSIIHEIFADENVMKLLKTVDSEPELDFPDAPLTRSKRKLDDDGLLPLNSSDDFYDYCDDLGLGSKEQAISMFDGNTTMDSVHTEPCEINADSCYNTNGEFDWQTWLAKINDREQERRDKDYNSDEDPDFNFMAEQEEPDIEDFRDDCATRVSKKELKSLNASCKHQNRAPKVIKTKDEIKHNAYSVDDFLQCKTLREKIAMLKSNPKLGSISKKRRKLKKWISPTVFTEEQKHTLKQQLQQHVQLLTQTCVLDSEMNSNFEDSFTFLSELEIFRQAGPGISHFDILHLSDSIDLVQNIKTSMSLDHNEENATEINEALIISNCPVFMYRELLPQAIPKKSEYHEKQPFTFHEDCLIAHGLHEMSQDFYLSPAELISQLILPHRSKHEITSRIKLMMMAKNRKNSINPINQYKRLGILPPPYRKITPIFSNNPKPIEMNGKLPNWLQHIKGRTKKCEENLRQDCTHLTAIQHQSSEENMTGSMQTAMGHWTHSMDEKILTICKKYNGPSKEALFLLTCAIPTRSKKHIRKRFHELMTMYCRTIECD